MGVLTDVQEIGEPQRRIDNIVRRSLKTAEETGELAEAVLSATSLSGGKGKHWMDIVEEAGTGLNESDAAPLGELRHAAGKALDDSVLPCP